MHIFEIILRDLLLAGSVVGPVFIHSQHGVAILNASEIGLAAIIQAHQQSQGQINPMSPTTAVPNP